MKPKRKPAGRAVKRESVPDGIRTKVLTALKIGNFRSTAAEYAGISPAQLSAWLRRGDPAADDFEKGSDFAAFYDEVRAAESEAEVRAVQVIYTQGMNDPNHLKWWLERKNPSKWARKDKLEIEDNRAQAPAEVDLSALDIDEVIELRRIMKKARAVTDGE